MLRKYIRLARQGFSTHLTSRESLRQAVNTVVEQLESRAYFAVTINRYSAHFDTADVQPRAGTLNFATSPAKYTESIDYWGASSGAEQPDIQYIFTGDELKLYNIGGTAHGLLEGGLQHKAPGNRPEILFNSGDPGATYGPNYLGTGFENWSETAVLSSAGKGSTVSYDVTYDGGDQTTGGGIIDAYSLPSATGYTTPLCDDCIANQYTGSPVRYLDGAAKMEFNDFIPSGASGFTLGRTWSNNSYSYDAQVASFGNGISLGGLDYLQDLSSQVSSGLGSSASDGTTIHPSAFAVVQSSTSAYAVFKTYGGIYDNAAGGETGKSTFADGTNTIIETDPDGTVSVYADFSNNWGAARRGQLISRTRPNGDGLTVTWDTLNDRPGSYTQTSTDDSGNPLTDQFDFTYVDGRVKSVQQSRNGTPIRTVDYGYYNGTDDAGNGAAGDIQYVTTRNGDEGSPVVSTSYYRWYTSNSSTGYAGGLKLYMSDGGYEKALHDVGTLDSDGKLTLAGVSDATLTNYADNYFEYDTNGTQHRVTKEIALGTGTGCSCGNTGEGTYTFSYFENTNSTSGNNGWRMRTTVGMPDGSQQIVYTNGSGATIFKVVVDQPNTSHMKTYSTWYRYDDNGNIVAQAEGKAIATYDPSDAANVADFEKYPDLVGYGNGTPNITLGAKLTGVGKITATNYFTSANAADPSEYNYKESTGYLDPATGTFTSTESWTYTDGGRGDGIWNIATDTTYPNAGSLSNARETTYNYNNSWWQDANGNNTAQPKWVTTSLAPIGTDQHGSGSAITTQTYYDSAGRVVWYVDGSGYINYFEYDPLTGAKTTEVDDVDPTTISNPAVAGPTRAPGLDAAKNLTTTIEVDSQGRKKKVIDPNGNVTFYVYDDTTEDGDPRKLITYVGWTVSYDSNNNPIYTTTGPVYATIDDPATGTKDTISYTYSAANGLPVDTNGVPTGAEWNSANNANIQIQSLVRQKRNVSDQVVEEDTYTDLSGLTYDPAAAGWAALGTSGTNYLSTKYKYDSGARLYQTTTPDGTITMSVYDARGLVQSTWKGTNNTGSTETDPTGGGVSSDNNMVGIASFTYDDDGNQLTGTQYADASHSYTTTYQYDVRDRLTDSRGPDGVATKFTLDNLGEQTQTDTYADVDSDFVIDPGEWFGKTTVAYDDQGQAYQSAIYKGNRDEKVVGSITSSVSTIGGISTATATVTLNNHGFQTGQLVTIQGADQSLYNGAFAVTAVDANTFTYTFIVPEGVTLGTSATGQIVARLNKRITTNYWYDPRGNLIKTQSPSGLLTKTFYDGAGRVFRTDTAADPTEVVSGTYADALTLTNDQVIEQNDYYLDAGGRTRIASNWKRDGAEPASTTGVPTADNYDHSAVGYFYDAANRLIATADYGRDGGESGASSSDALVWNTTGYSYKDSDSDGTPDVVDHPDGYDPGLSYAGLTGYDWIYKGYTYNSAGRLQFTTDNANRQTETLYDLAGRKMATIENYTGTGTVTETTPGDENRTTEYVYDAQGRMSQQIALNPQGSGNGVQQQATTFVYASDIDRSLVSVTLYPDSTTTVSYDSFGKGTVTGTDATFSTYDRLGRQITTTDQRGVVHTYTYDSAGRLSTDSIGTGALSSGVDGAVRAIQYTYDDQSRVSTVSSLDVSSNVVNQVAYTYDAWGNVASDAESHSGPVDSTTPVTRYIYGDGKLPPVANGPGPKLVSAVSRKTHSLSKYDIPLSLDESLPTIEPRLHGPTTIVLTFDQNIVAADGTLDGSEFEISNGSFASASISNKALTLNITGVSDSSWVRIKVDGLTNASGDPISGGTSLTIGALLGDVDGSGLVDSHDYTAYQTTFLRGLPSSLYYFDIDSTGAINSFDANYITASNGHSLPTYGSSDETDISFERLAKIIYPTNNGRAYGTFITTYGGSAVDSALVRPTGMDYGVLSPIISYGYLGEDQILRITHSGITGGLVEQAGTQAGHYANLDRYGRTGELVWTNDADTSRSEDIIYSYDRRGNVVAKENNSAGTGASNWDETYGYDDLNRLVNYDRGTLSGGTISSPQFEQTWNLDDLGNWAGYSQTNNDITLPANFATFSQTRTENLANETISTTGGGYAGTSYDAAGNQTAGPKTGAESTQLGYFYDGWNRLVGVDANNDGDLFDAGDVRYSYDGTGRRITKFIDSTNDGTNDAGDTEEYYQNEQNQVLEVRNGTVTGGTKTIDSYAKELDLWGLTYVDMPVGIELDNTSDGWPDKLLWPTSDADHNITSLVSDAGKIVERYEYTPYGQRIILNGNSNYANTGADADGADWSVDTNGSDYGFLLGFQGLRMDPETGNWYARARYESPAEGMWTQRDPLGANAYVTEGLNLQEMTQDNPVIYNDPTGRDVEENCMKYATDVAVNFTINPSLDFGSNPSGVLLPSFARKVAKNPEYEWDFYAKNPAVMQMVVDKWFQSMNLGHAIPGPKYCCSKDDIVKGLQRKVCLYIYWNPGFLLNFEWPKHDMHWIVQDQDGSWSGKAGKLPPEKTSPEEQVGWGLQGWKTFIGCWIIKGQPKPNLP